VEHRSPDVRQLRGADRTCERSRIELVASGERFELGPGDAVVFRGDQRRSYHNLDARRPAVAVSVVCFATGA
jgi:XRE family transcriptional regulator, regulator of sulfur utilization